MSMTLAYLMSILYVGAKRELVDRHIKEANDDTTMEQVLTAVSKTSNWLLKYAIHAHPSLSDLIPYLFMPSSSSSSLLANDA